MVLVVAILSVLLPPAWVFNTILARRGDHVPSRSDGPISTTAHVSQCDATNSRSSPISGFDTAKSKPRELVHPMVHWCFPPLLYVFHLFQVHFGLFHSAYQLCFVYYCIILWFKAFVMSRDKTWWRWWHNCFFSSSTPPLLLLGGPCTPGWQHRSCYFRYKRFNRYKRLKRGERQLVCETAYPFHPPDVPFLASLGAYIDKNHHITLGVIPTLLLYFYNALYPVARLWLSTRLQRSHGPHDSARNFQRCLGLLLLTMLWLFTVPDALLLWCVTAWIFWLWQFGSLDEDAAPSRSDGPISTTAHVSQRDATNSRASPDPLPDPPCDYIDPDGNPVVFLDDPPPPWSFPLAFAITILSWCLSHHGVTYISLAYVAALTSS